jgi:integrase
MARREGLPSTHPKSVQLYLDALNSLMRWLVAEGELSTNPAARLGVAIARRNTDKDRRPLTTSELQRFFTSGPFRPPAASRGWAYWVPLIGLFAGMRLGEITGLIAADVVERNGIWIFDLKPNSLRPLKTLQSVRVVPVHPTLISVGFLQHAAQVPHDGALFPDLPGISSGTSNAAQKAMGRWIRSVFPDDRGIVFHSLRHTWTDALRNGRVPRDIAERLGG